MSKLLELADRVEALTGPDREVDAAIASGLGWNDVRWNSAHGNYWSHEANDYLEVMLPVPNWTASLDAAMTLVPEGCLFHVRTLWDGPKTWGYAHVHTYGDDAEDCDGKRHLDDYVGNAATPALALCAAALRARHAVEGESRP